jgi:WD40 repeat protein
VPDPTPERIPGTEADVTVVAFSPDGQLAATGGLSGTVQFRDPRTFAPLGAPVRVGSGVMLTLVFSPDSSLLAAGDYAAGATAQVRLIDATVRGVTTSVRVVTPDDIGALGAVLGRAYADDPVWSWVYPQPDRSRRIARMFRTLLGATRERGATVLTDEGRRGAAIWQRSEARSLGALGNLRMAPPSSQAVPAFDAAWR